MWNDQFNASPCQPTPERVAVVGEEAARGGVSRQQDIERYEKSLALRRARIILYQRQMAQLRKAYEEGPPGPGV